MCMCVYFVHMLECTFLFDVFVCICAVHGECVCVHVSDCVLDSPCSLLLSPLCDAWPPLEGPGVPARSEEHTSELQSR